MGVGIILDILVVEYKIALLYLPAVILQRLNLQGAWRGEAVKHRSPEQQDITQGPGRREADPGWAGCWPAAACRASVALKPCRVFPYPGLPVAVLPCHALGLLAQSTALVPASLAGGFG